MSTQETMTNNGTELTGPKRVATGHGWTWIATGFDLFKRNPGTWILTCILWFVILIAASFVPLVGQVLYTIASPLLLGGLMLGANEQSLGGDFRVSHLFAGLTHNGTKLLIMSVIYFIASSCIMLLTLGNDYLVLMAGGMPAMASNAPLEFLLRLLIAMALLIPVLMALWFAPALIVINDVPVIESLKLSFAGCMKNMLALLVYGLVLFVLLILAIIPLFLGLLIVGPVMVASIYTSYRDIFCA